MLEILLYKIDSNAALRLLKLLKDSRFVKKKLRCLPVNIAKLLRPDALIEHLLWLLLQNYFKYFRLFTHLEVKNIRATVLLNKTKLSICTRTGDKQLQKRNVATLAVAHQAKKNQYNLDSGCWNDNRAVYIATNCLSQTKMICSVFEQSCKKVSAVTTTK